MRLTFDGDQIDYPLKKPTTTCDLVTAKTHWKSVISTKGARYMTTDVKGFYLNTPMENYKYIPILLANITQVTIEKYNLKVIARNGKVLVEIRKGMYGLPQDGLLAHKRLLKYLSRY